MIYFIVFGCIFYTSFSILYKLFYFFQSFFSFIKVYRRNKKDLKYIINNFNVYNSDINIGENEVIGTCGNIEVAFFPGNKYHNIFFYIDNIPCSFISKEFNEDEVSLLISILKTNFRKDFDILCNKISNDFYCYLKNNN